MTLPLPALIKDKPTQENFDAIASQFPVQAPNMANKSVPDKALAKPVIAGAVSAAGAIEAGSGFTPTHPGVGEYKITLTTELPTVGIIIPALIGGGGEANVIYASGPSKTFFTLSALTFALALKNGSFSFMIKAT